jgi:nicotinamide-nucleotide amidase
MNRRNDPVPGGSPAIGAPENDIPPGDADLLDLAVAVSKRLEETGRRLVTAESCTGGWIAKVCTELPGASSWFRGGAASYANEAKTAMLGVTPGLLDEQGAVSEAVVRAMATGALERLGGETSVAVSGIAGPDGGTPDKPVGTVWFAWATHRDGRIDVSTARERFSGDRDAVRRQAVERALRGVLDANG